MNKNFDKMGIYTRNGLEFTFNFHTSLRAIDKMKFVDSVTNLVVGDNYNSIIRNMIFDFNIIRIFTDVDITDITSPENNDAINMIEDLLDETNIVDIVKTNVDVGLIAELNKAVDDNIEYRTGIHKNPITESLSRLLDTIEHKVSDIDTESMMKMAQSISNVSDELTVDKMLEAYAKSDMFKKRHGEIDSNGNTTSESGEEVKKTRTRKKSVSEKAR